MKPELRMTKIPLVGKIREYRPGHWQYYLNHEGRRWFFQKFGGKPLRTENDAYLLQYYILNQIREGTFDPALLAPVGRNRKRRNGSFRFRVGDRQPR